MLRTSSMLDFAVETAREAGALLRDHFGRTVDVNYKSSPIDLVTEVDLLSESLIKERIAAHYPRHAILAEESGHQGGTSEYRWLIDPLDGTTNYAHGYPFFCVALALEYQGEIVLGVVYDPLREELFVAERGAGATLNGRPIRVSRTETLAQGLLATGFPYTIRSRPDESLAYFARFVKTAQAIRRDGSAVLDLCYLACGRFDGFWELGLKPWDMAAGALMVEEAGGRVTRFDGSPFRLYEPEILASNGRIHDEMIAVLIGA
ncbi:MAG: inositol monophosphatase [Blastocatellia bacterium]|nr:inositol monophosphatase [Blastocatellia bacterium]MDW8167781.1 inositol monophosphatase family protein [Acidobacteriota bacterium]MDW8256602.1 inositol monophosphatase family protein [Acidobacteriota bacterium]